MAKERQNYHGQELQMCTYFNAAFASPKLMTFHQLDIRESSQMAFPGRKDDDCLLQKSEKLFHRERSTYL
ncbi:MAG: hypothetical protein ACJAVW_003456 [Spirosomataceae bacterium]